MERRGTPAGGPAGPGTGPDAGPSVGPQPGYAGEPCARPHRHRYRSGSMDVQAPDGATFRGSSGQLTLTIPTGQALRVEVESIWSGHVHVPDGLTRVSGQGKEGVWKTPGYDSGSNRVNPVIESVSSGSVKLQMEG